MCLLNYTPWDSDGPEYPLPRGRPRVAWVVPVNMSELGAGLQAIIDTMPQVTTLRLCHRFRDGPLSRLPQELLEHIIDDAKRVAQVECRPGWYLDSVCWQGTCLPEDHYSSYGEHVEELWQDIFVNQQCSGIDEAALKDKTKTEKPEMVSDWVMGNSEYRNSEPTLSLHFDARFRWLDRTCLCPKRHSTTDRKFDNSIPLNNVSMNTLLGSVYAKVLMLLNRNLGSKQSYFTKSYPMLCTISCQTNIARRSTHTTPCATLLSLGHSKERR
jgi:hypothetical protein